MVARAHVALVVADMEKSVKFYTELLGFKVRGKPAPEWTLVETPGLTIGLHPPGPQYPPPGTKGTLMIGLVTDDTIDAAVERLTQRGVTFSGPIVRDPAAGGFANFTDPDGNPLYLWDGGPWKESAA